MLLSQSSEENHGLVTFLLLDLGLHPHQVGRHFLLRQLPHTLAGRRNWVRTCYFLRVSLSSDWTDPVDVLNPKSNFDLMVFGLAALVDRHGVAVGSFLSAYLADWVDDDGSVRLDLTLLLVCFHLPGDSPVGRVLDYPIIQCPFVGSFSFWLLVVEALFDLSSHLCQVAPLHRS